MKFEIMYLLYLLFIHTVLGVHVYDQRCFGTFAFWTQTTSCKKWRKVSSRYTHLLTSKFMIRKYSSRIIMAAKKSPSSSGKSLFTICIHICWRHNSKRQLHTSTCLQLNYQIPVCVERLIPASITMVARWHTISFSSFSLWFDSSDILMMLYVIIWCMRV